MFSSLPRKLLFDGGSAFSIKAQHKEIIMHKDAHIILKPLQSKGALLDKNHDVNGLIASGDNKLAIDWTPAINPCAFP